MSLLFLLLFIHCLKSQKQTCGDTVKCGEISSDDTCSCQKNCQDSTTLDCCSGFIDACASCEQLGCGKHAFNKACSCAPDCEYLNNCCSDYQDICKDHTFSDCPVPVNPGEDRRKDTSKLRIITYDLDYLFIDYDHSMGEAVCPGDGCKWKNTSIAQTHLTTLASYIKQINSDIILLQSICDCWTLEQLLIEINDNTYKPYLLKGTDIETGENVGMITRIDPIMSLNRSNEYYKYPIQNSNCGYPSRQESQFINVDKHFVTEFIINGLDKKLTVFNVHFIDWPKEPEHCAKREAQASIISNMVRQTYNAGNYIIVTGNYGDFSDTVPDCNDDVPSSKVTKMLRESGNLFNYASFIQNQNERYTYWYNIYDDCKDTIGKDRGMIDQFLMSDELYDYFNGIRIDHFYENGCDCLYSDHWPVIVDLKT